MSLRYFGNRQPRGFHYTYRFHNERRDILDQLRNGVSPEELARQSLNEASNPHPTEGLRRQRQSAGCLPGVILIIIGILLLTLFII